MDSGGLSWSLMDDQEGACSDSALPCSAPASDPRAGRDRGVLAVAAAILSRRRLRTVPEASLVPGYRPRLATRRAAVARDVLFEPTPRKAAKVGSIPERGVGACDRQLTGVIRSLRRMGRQRTVRLGGLLSEYRQAAVAA